MCVHDIKSVFKELNGFPYKMHVFREMQFVWPHCYTVVSCQPILGHSVYKNSAVYLSGARVRFFERYAIWVPRLIIIIVDTSMPDMTATNSFSTGNYQRTTSVTSETTLRLNATSGLSPLRLRCGTALLVLLGIHTLCYHESIIKGR